MTELALLTATEALARIRAGSLSAADYRAACLARIAAREPEIRAFAHHDAALVGEGAEGALAGMPVGVKDVLDTADQPSEYGSPIWQGYRPRADAAAVAGAKAAGAVVMGKTVTTEFATRRPGPTANPHHLGHTPGGSSSGSAAGVAAGFFPFAFGTQTAGSIIRPAAFCGVVGYKPSFGLIARLGMKLMSESLDTIGVMARSVADCALLAGAVAGRDLAYGPVSAPRIGLCRSSGTPVASPETLAMLEQVAGRLSAAGALVREFVMPQAFLALETAQPLVMNFESARSMGWELAHHRDGISDGLRERLDWGASRGEAEIAEAYAQFHRLQTAFPAALGDLDILITPAAPGEAPEGLGWTGDPAFNLAWTALHVPCVTVPAGTGPLGLPLGVQIVGRRGQDAAVLGWAEWVGLQIGVVG